MKSREYDDDDGRVIADMSGIDDRPVVSRWLGLPHNDSRRRELPEADPSASQRPAYGNEEMDSEERRFFIFGAMKASVMLGMVYVVIFAIVIGILVLIW